MRGVLGTFGPVAKSTAGLKGSKALLVGMFCLVDGGCDGVEATYYFVSNGGDKWFF